MTDTAGMAIRLGSIVINCDQMHLDLYTDDQPGEVRRLLGLGAGFVRHHEDPDDDYVVLTDPEGNPFCVCAVAGHHNTTTIGHAE